MMEYQLQEQGNFFVSSFHASLFGWLFLVIGSVLSTLQACIRKGPVMLVLV